MTPEASASKIQREAAMARSQIEVVRERYRENEAAIAREKDKINEARAKIFAATTSARAQRLWSITKPNAYAKLHDLTIEKREIEAELSRLKEYRKLDMVGPTSTGTMKNCLYAINDDSSWATPELVQRTRMLMRDALERAVTLGGGES